MDVRTDQDDVARMPMKEKAERQMVVPAASAGPAGQRPYRPRGKGSQWRPMKNMSSTERVLRVFGGLLLALAGSVFVGPQLHGVFEVAAWTLLAVSVADLVVSGLLGYCPVYRYLAVPWARRSSR
jgi:hypothetical protein